MPPKAAKRGRLVPVLAAVLSLLLAATSLQASLPAEPEYRIRVGSAAPPGSLVLLTDPTGRPIERYEYSPYGERWILVDSTPPAIEQIRVAGDAVVIELSEEVLLSEIEEAITAGELTLTDQTDPALPEAIGLTASQPMLSGRQAGRRIVLTPDEAPAAGAPLDLVLPANALRDLFGNVAADGASDSLTWPAAGGELLVRDTTAPRIEQVCVTTGGFLEVTLSEIPDVAQVDAVFQIDGAPASWSLGPDGYTLRTDSALPAGSHTLTASTDPLDLAGLGLASAWSETFTVSATSPETLVFSEPLPGLTSASTVGNRLGFHGLPHDPVTGFVYARHRYLDPELGRFLRTDPLGYVDGPNLYQYALNNPVSYSDPSGLVVSNLLAGAASVGVGVVATCVFDECGSYSAQDAAIDFGLGFATHGLSAVGQLRHLRHGLKGAARFGARAGAEVGLDIGAEYVRTTIRSEDASLGQLALGGALNLGIGEAGAGIGSRLGRLGNFSDLGPATSRGLRQGAVEGTTELTPRLRVPKGAPRALPAPRGNINPIGEYGIFYVDPKGNVISTPRGGRITASPDGRFIQARDAAGNPTGVRIDGPHRPTTHSDPRGQRPHGHVPGVTNSDGTPWLPIKQ